MVDPLSGLNDKQREVVLATHGPVLVLAGAGSGKTRALTHRIAYLIQQKIAHPTEIMAVTFTNKAAKEMKERVANLLGSLDFIPQSIGTFHSLGAKMLREQSAHLPRSRQFMIMDAQDSERLVRQSLRDAGLSTKEWSPTSIRHRISSAKNSLMSPMDMASAAGSTADEVAATVYARYEKLLAQNDAYDFDDLLLRPLELLEHNPSLQLMYQNRWKWLSVDEYQDTNPPQAKLIELLLGTDENICVVGDDYQAIYSWRGADVDHILSFSKRFSSCKTIYLTRNYRSTQHILEAANHVIAENEAQMHKELWTKKSAGLPVRLIGFPSDRHEALFARQQIERHVAEGGKLSDCVLLYRTNAQSRVLEEEFLTHGLPYTIVGGYRFYERREIKDAVAFLQLLSNPMSGVSVRRIADALWKGVGLKTLAKWEAKAAEEGISLLAIIKREAGEKASVRPTLRAFASVSDKSFANVQECLDFLLRKSGYMEYLQSLPDGEERAENIEELFNVSSGYEHVHEFLEDVALLTDIDSMPEDADRVTCMTLHASKGLEFPYVLLVGCEEGLLPHVNSLESRASLEEERRLMYVGMTRAKKQLTITYALQRLVRGQLTPQTPSRFLQHLPEAVERSDFALQDDGSNPVSSHSFSQETPTSSANTDITEGEFVMHPIFGQGVVIQVSGSVLTCIFEGYGMKTFDAAVIGDEFVH